MDIHPIVTAEDHREAVQMIQRLWDAPPGSPDGRVLEVLATLVDAYEAKTFPIEAAHPVDVLRTHMEMTGRTQGDLADLFGSRSRASEVLARKRALSMDMAHKLHSQWGIPADVLIQPYELEIA